MTVKNIKMNSKSSVTLFALTLSLVWASSAFAAPPTPPTVTSPTFADVTTTTATLGGNVVDYGNRTATGRGVEWGTSTGNYPNSVTEGTTATGEFTVPVTGLPSDTTIYFRAWASNTNQTGYSSEASFTTDPVALTAPTVTVQAATDVGTRSATLNGTVTVNGSAADNDTYFEYGTSSGPPYDVTTGTVSTIETGTFSLPVSGLEPGTLYYYRACAAANEAGGLTGCSAETTFTTDPLVAPTVTVQPATSVVSDGATLHGTVTVNGSAANNDTYFKYGTSSGVYTVTTGSAGTVTTGTFQLAVSGLDPTTTYYYIACATANETGGLEGCSAGEESFTTTADLTAPTVTVQPATAIGTNGATLHGTVTVNGSGPDNDTYFKYGTSSGVYTTTTGSAGTVVTGAFSLAVSGLDPNTTYYYIACATANEVGGLEGCSASEETFTTLKIAPTVTVQPATSIGSRTATLNGTVTVNGSAADNTTYFKYGTSSGVYGTTTPAAGTVTTGSFSYGLTGLNPDTTYYYIACATANEAGGLEGCSAGEEVFTTEPLTAPTVTVQAATSLGSRTATLNGTITVNGSAPDNNTYFEYGTSSGPPYDTTSATVSTIATGSFALPLTGLEPDTLYYYRACATANETGGLTGCSAATTFTTNPLTAPTVTVQAATGVGTNSATMNGTVNVNGSAPNNDTYFKYGTASGGPYGTTTTSAGTVATGPFAKTVSGLDSDVTYYYIACATANETGGLEGCSAGEQSFTTVASVSQATNLSITNIGSTRMTLFWTKGIGDGSIVLMKEGSAVDATPIDGVDYTASSTFGSGDVIGAGNYVVYIGTGTSVHVTGLTQGLTYHVAVHTYTGAGATSDYLEADPAVGNETTSANTPHNVAVLNIDDTVTCTTGCHGMHGSPLVSRGTVQETLCVTCHNPSGMANALTNDFALHTNAKGTPPESPGEVDCGGCHELHNPGTDDTTFSANPVTSTSDFNLYYLRKNADKYVTGALTDDMVMHEEGAWVLDNITYYQGPCQVCHTDVSLPYRNTVSDTGHQGGNQNCKGCHGHGGGFGGAGGDCTGCHNSAQDADGAGGNPGRREVISEFSGGAIVSSHLPGTIDAADCEVCHNHSSGSAHMAGKVNLFNVDTGAGIEIATYTDPRSSQAEAEKLTTFCVNCHDSDGANGDTTPFTTGNTVVDIQSSLMEHTNDGSGSVSCFGDGNFGCHGSGHGGQKLAILAPAESGPGTSPDFTDENETFCLTCHDGGGPALTPPAPNVLADFGGSFAASAQTVIAESNAFINMNHDVLPADKDANAAVNTTRPVITCTNCHLQPHDSPTGGPSIKDPDTATVGDPLKTGTAFTQTYAKTNVYNEDGHNWSYQDSAADQSPITPEGGGTHDDTDYVAFCLTCHDGTTPPGVTMSGSMLDIATTYGANDYHGRVPNNGTGTSTNRGGMKAPWTAGGDGKDEDPSAPYAAMPCTICHGPHGSGSIYNLRTSINVAGTQMSTGSWGTGDPYDSIIGTTYEIPTYLDRNGERINRTWGAWCTFCHHLTGHGYAEDQVCRSGHIHGGNDF
jgi:hypothetical protein